MRRKKKRLITHADSGIASLPPAPSAPAQASDAGSAVVTSDWTVGFLAIPGKVEHKPLPVRRQTEPIIAYRGWHLCDDNGPALMSVTAGVVWDGPILRSGARPMERMYWYVTVTPTRDPALGIFAYKDAWNSGTYGRVWGEVELFGTVIRHDFGYRAEIARIRRLVVPRSTQFYGPPAAGYVRYVYPNCGIVTDDTLAQLAKRYQCDVRWWNGPFD